MGWLGFAVVVFVIVYLIFPDLHRRSKPVIDLSVLPHRFVVFDLETTGLKPGHHQIIEIGAIRVNRDSDMHDTFTALIRIEKKVPKKITKITGITAEMLEREGRPLDEVLSEFIAFVGDRRLVAFNAPFDVAFLAFALVDSSKVLRNEVSCALSMARRAWPGRVSYRLSALAAAGNLDTTGAHRALADCRLTLTVYVAAVSQLRRVD